MYYDYFDEEVKPTIPYLFLKDGVVVGQFVAENRRPVDQAIAVRDEMYPGAELFVVVTEYKQQKEETPKEVTV